MKSMMKTVAAVAFVTLVGAVPMAFAHGGFGGYGYGGHMMGNGYGGPMMGYGHGGHMGWWGNRDNSNITQEQAAQLEQSEEAFYRDTLNLRENIYDKSAAIRQELSKENPDGDVLNSLQKDLSKLESQLDQKQLSHELELRKIAPELGNRYSGDYGPGMGWR